MVELIIKRHKERNQTILIITVCTMICFAPIVYFVNQLCRAIFGTGFTFDTLSCYAVLAVMILASLKQLHFRIKTDVLVVLLVFAVAYALSYSLIHNNKNYMFTQWTDFASNPLYLLFAYSLPAYVFMRYITDYDRLLETCRYFSLIVVFCSLGSFILMFLRDSQPQYMSFSYNLVFATSFSWVYFFEKKRTMMSLLAAIIGAIMIFFAGARGPLVCVLFSMIAYTLISKTFAKKKPFLVCFFILGGLIIMLLWQPIVTALKESVDSLGISSRTIDLMLDGDLFSDSSRGEIQKKIIESFSLFGSGLYGDRLLGENHYAHNLIIELFAQWGYLMGTAIFALLGILLFKGFRTKNTSLQMLILVSFSSGVIKLMFSGSYLAHNAVFFMLLAACVNSMEAEETLTAVERAGPEKKKSKYIKAYSRYS